MPAATAPKKESLLRRFLVYPLYSPGRSIPLYAHSDTEAKELALAAKRHWATMGRLVVKAA